MSTVAQAVLLPTQVAGECATQNGDATLDTKLNSIGWVHHPHVLAQICPSSGAPTVSPVVHQLVP